jgi:hypothetical protein
MRHLTIAACFTIVSVAFAVNIGMNANEFVESQANKAAYLAVLEPSALLHQCLMVPMPNEYSFPKNTLIQINVEMHNYSDNCDLSGLKITFSNNNVLTHSQISPRVVLPRGADIVTKAYFIKAIKAGESTVSISDQGYTLDYHVVVY